VDPQACWDQLLEAVSNSGWDEVSELATALLVWIDRGGFPPQSVVGTDLGQEWDRAVARFSCCYALAIATRESQSEKGESDAS
jgi:hypothetical protein